MLQFKKMYGSGTTTIIFSNEDLDDMIKIVKALEDSDVLMKGVTETIKNETKKQKCRFLSMLSGTLCASLLSDLSTKGQGMYRTGYGSKKITNATTSSD